MSNPRLAIIIGVLFVLLSTAMFVSVFTGMEQALPIADSKRVQPSIKPVAHLSTYTPRPPITIIGDDQFTPANGVISGNGSKTNPYVISGWEFNTSVVNTQIYMYWTNKSFVIRNCHLYNNNYSVCPLGVYLRNARNGVIENCTIDGWFYRGIYIIANEWNSNSLIVFNNTITGSQVGVWMFGQLNYVYSVTVKYNNICDCAGEGVYLGYVYQSVVMNNTIYSTNLWALVISCYSHDNWIAGNSFINNGGGINIDDMCARIHIYKNDFINNGGGSGNQALINITDAYCDYAGGGNFWSDYLTKYPAASNNGTVWNMSYVVPGVGAKDNYPLVHNLNLTPSLPALYYPSKGSRTLMSHSSLTWMPSVGAASILYDVYFGTTNPPTTAVATGISSTSFNVNTVPGMKYYWRVRASNAYGVSNSTVFNFSENRKPSEARTPISPLNGVSGIYYGITNVSWTKALPDPDGDIITYYWYVSNQSSMTPPYVASGTTTANHSADFVSKPGTTYYWNVRTNDSYEWSDWSNSGVPWFYATAAYQAPHVLLKQPDGGEIWRNGTIQTVRWNVTDANPLPGNPISLYYSTNNGLNWTVIGNSCPNNGTYKWKVPDDVNSTQCRVEVECTDAALLKTNDTSNGTFTITNWTAGPIIDNPPVVSVLNPNGGEEWRNGTVQRITWTATDDKPFPANPVSLFYSIDNGTNWNTLSASYPNNGSYAWRVPDGINSTLCLIKVRCTDSGLNEANDTSNATFTIINWTAPVPTVDNPPIVYVKSPNGGEVWNQSTIHFIRWNATDDKPLSDTCINISYSSNNGSSWTIIGYQLDNNGSYAWLVPDTVNSTQCLVKVECTDAAMQTTIDTSNGTFTIKEVITITDNPPQMYLLAPKADDTLYGGEGCTVRWNATDDRVLPSNCVNVSYSPDNGANWTRLATNHTNNGSFIWTVPRNDTTEAKVQVTIFDSKGQMAMDTSGKFTIERWNKSADIAPVITSTPMKNATVGKEWTYKMAADDTDIQWGDYLTFSLDKSPQGMEINETSGLVKWTPDAEGNYTVVVVVTDSQGKSTNQTFTITVAAGPEEEISLDFTMLMLVGFAIFVVVLALILILIFRKKKSPVKYTKDGEGSDPAQQKVFAYVASHPDDDFESISAALGMDKKVLDDKLQFFIGSNIIEERKDGPHRRFSVTAKGNVQSASQPLQDGGVSNVATEKAPEPPKPWIIPQEPFATVEPKVESPNPEEINAEPKPIAPEPPQTAAEVVQVPPIVPETDEKDDKPEKDGFSLGDKVLMLLYRNERYRNEIEVPYEITQIGMCDYWNVKQNVMSKVLERKDAQGYITKVKKHVKDGKIRLDAYFLTHDGEIEAARLVKRKEEMDGEKAVP